MLTTEQVANQIGFSHPKLLRLRREGKIPQGRQLHKYAGVEWSEEEVRKIREVVNG
jgi:predicted DNA-binding transcriptional regulator AlpA